MLCFIDKHVAITLQFNPSLGSGEQDVNWEILFECRTYLKLPTTVFKKPEDLMDWNCITDSIPFHLLAATETCHLARERRSRWRLFVFCLWTCQKEFACSVELTCSSGRLRQIAFPMLVLHGGKWVVQQLWCWSFTSCVIHSMMLLCRSILTEGSKGEKDDVPLFFDQIWTRAH